ITQLREEEDAQLAWNEESAAAGDLVAGIAAKHLAGAKLDTFMRAYQTDLDKRMRKQGEVSSNDKISDAVNLCVGARKIACPQGMTNELFHGAEFQKMAQAGLFEDGGRLTGSAMSRAYTAQLKKLTPCNSFTPGTKVLMADGSAKPIEQVKVGDKILAGDPKTGSVHTETVTAEIQGEGLKQLVRITIETEDGSAQVTATAEHPFWVPKADTWVDAADLHPGQWVQVAEGAGARISRIQQWTALSAKVYNLSVSDLHTYYVLAGQTPVLVHNSNCNSLTRAQSDEVANFLGYTKTKMKSAGGAPIWENKKAGGGQPRYITYDRTGHNKQAVFKGASFRNPFQSTKDSARDGTYGLDVSPTGEVLGLKWLAK
ncbi:polymorphic toxin-type HINT domain-containing protein, partial [Streptomyces albidoflavus]